MTMPAAGFAFDAKDPLNFEFRAFREKRDLQAIFNNLLESKGGVDGVITHLLEARISPDDRLGLAAGLWDQLPVRRPDLAAIGLIGLAEAFDGDLKRAEALKAFIPELSDFPGAKEAFNKIKAISRAKQRYYFATRYQARDANRLRSQIFSGAEKPIAENATFICMGSCFATNLGAALVQRGVPNVSGVRYQDDAEPLSVLSYIMDDAQFQNDVRQAADCTIILTAGFAEAEGKFLTPDQVADIITGMHATLKAWNPRVRFFVTVSPVPLKGTLSGLSPYEANAVSKAIVRLGVEKARASGLEYFPSYELVTQHFPAMGVCSIGESDGVPFHVNGEVLLFVTDLFISHYLPWIDLSKPIPAVKFLNMRRIAGRT